MHITNDNKRLILQDVNFDQSPEFKVLHMFQNIFQCTKLEIRNECKTWIFNVTNEETIAIMQYLREWLNIHYFKNFLMEIDVSVVIDLDNRLIVITHERSTKYKAFIELARQVAKIFEILKFLDLQTNTKMLKYLKHYKNSKNKTFLVFQIPLSTDSHLNSNLSAVSFTVSFNEKNLQIPHKMDAQSSSSLNVQISPSFSQSFLLCTLRRDIANIGTILESLDNSADTLVEFNEYILGRILYPSIMDGEDKYNVTFVTRSRDEVTIYYRDYFALDIVFPSEPKSSVFHFLIHDKAQSCFYTDKDDMNSNIVPIPNFHEVLKIKIGKDYFH